MKRRLLSLFVVAIFLLTMFPLSAMAAPGDLINSVSASYDNDDRELDISISKASGVNLVLTLQDSSDDEIPGRFNQSQTRWSSDDSLDAGNYELEIVATDSAGNTQTYTATFTIERYGQNNRNRRVVNFVGVLGSVVAPVPQALMDAEDAAFAISGDDLVIVGVQKLVADADFTVVFTINGDEQDPVDLDDFAYDLSDAEIGDEFTAVVHATKDGHDPEESEELQYVFTLAELAGYYNLSNAYILTLDLDGGVRGFSFSKEPEKVVGGYYFFEDDEVDVSFTLFQYYQITDIELDDEDLVLRGSNKTTLEFNNGSGAQNVYLLEVDTKKSTTQDTSTPVYYTIKAFAGVGGTITPSGDVKVVNGGSATFLIIPNSGYVIDSVLVDGVDKGAISSYTFTDLDANRSIIASFKKTTTVTPTPTTTPGATIPPIIPSIPATGSASMLVPGLLALLAGVAILPRRRSK